MYDNAIDVIEKYKMRQLLAGGILVGFSGGPDSVMLLSFLYEYRLKESLEFKIACAHVNHMIRGEEADRDEEFSRSFCSSLGVEFFSTRVDVPAISLQTSRGLEETARNVRYSYFEDILKGRNDISCVGLAHNSSDNAETVLLNMLRGTGLVGMCGIPPVREHYVRPLISVTKKEISGLLEQYSIEYVVDSTNSQNNYSRNHIRNNIAPLFAELSDDPENKIFRMTENLRVCLDYIRLQAESVLRIISDPFCFEISILRGLHKAVFVNVFTALCKRVSGAIPEESHILSIYDALDSNSFSFSIPGKYDFVCQQGVCSFVDKKHSLDMRIFNLSLGENKIDGYNISVFIGTKPHKSSLNIYKTSIYVKISDDIINRGLSLRFRRVGDEYRFGGMTRKLKKIFNDRGIPSFLRDRIPVFVDNSGILWVPGLPVRDGAYDDMHGALYLTVCLTERLPSEEGAFLVPRCSNIMTKKKGLDNT